MTATERALWSKLLTEAFAARGLLPEAAVECTRPDVAIATAEVNAGIAVGPKVPLRRDTALHVVFRPLQPRISVPVLAVTPRGHALQRAVEALIDQLKITAQELFRGYRTGCDSRANSRGHVSARFRRIQTR